MAVFAVGKEKRGRVIPRSENPSALPAAGLIPANPERLHLSFSLLLGQVMVHLRGAFAGCA